MEIAEVAALCGIFVVSNAGLTIWQISKMNADIAHIWHVLEKLERQLEDVRKVIVNKKNI